MSGARALSVVMPVHNAGPFLDEAVADILGQSFGDFEFVILDDGSTDGSLDCLHRWAAKDRRIRLIENAACTGPVASSNRIVRESRAPLVARMDADDRAHPERLKRQIDTLAAHPDAVLVGTLYDTIDARGRCVRPPDRARLLRKSPFAPFSHPTVMFRREAFERTGGYRPEAARWEDVDLYLRMAKQGRILVVTESLASLRQSEASTRLTAGPTELEQAMDGMYRTLFERGPDDAGRLVPEAFLPGAVIRVWNGRRPRILPRLWRQAALGWDIASLRMLVWATWAEVSPRTLRMALTSLLAARNWRCRRSLLGRAVIEWKPGR
jgi:glycosyltransferase involved in cell wall biosynthesis